MTRDACRRYLVAYDVVNDARRLRVARKLESYGDRIQYSVFVVDVRPARIVRLMQTLEQIINSTDDSILLCDLGPVTALDGQRFVVVGRRRPLTDDGPLIF
ncbi:MAG: CRISPR-associated endonuclease Cas2 [Sciscionella sp.]